MPGTEARFRVEIGGTDDLPQVRAMAGACKDGPRWPEEAWETFVRQEEGEGSRQRAVLLLGMGLPETRDGVGGAACLCGWLAGRVVAGSAEMECVLVDPAWRGRGLGRLLLERWMGWLAEQGATEVFLEVRVSNRGAIALYRSLGFVEHGRRRNYYREPVEDAIAMRAGLSQGG